MFDLERWNNVLPVLSNWDYRNKTCTDVASKTERKSSEIAIHQNGTLLWYNARKFS
jgi:hypothetical protein